jgi:hypothetical protein
MKYLLLLALPMTLLAGDIRLVREEAFKKTHNLKKIAVSNRPESYIALTKRMGADLPVSKDVGDSILVSIISSRSKTPVVFQDFDEVYDAHVITYVDLGSINKASETMFLRYLISLKPKFMDGKLRSLVKKYSDINGVYRKPDRKKLYFSHTNPELYGLEEIWIKKYAEESDPEEPPSPDGASVPVKTLNEITDVIHACQLTFVGDYVNSSVSNSPVLNINNRVLLDKKYLFPLYEAAIYSRDRAMKFNFIELMMYQPIIDSQVFNFIARQAASWKDGHLAKLVLKALHRHPSKENLQTVVLLFKSSTKPKLLGPSFNFSSPYTFADEKKLSREKKWVQLIAEFQENPNHAKDVELLREAGVIVK